MIDEFDCDGDGECELLSSLAVLSGFFVSLLVGRSLS